MASAAKQIEYIRENYGFLAGFLEIPEIKRILLKASADPKKPWSAAKLQGAVYATNWWKTTSQVTRQFTALKATDPASWAKQQTDTRNQIRQAAQQAGVKVTEQQVIDWSYKVNKYGWTPAQVQQSIGAQFKYNPQKAATGQAQLTVDKVKEIASAYLVPLSNSTVQKWAQDVVGGNVDLAAFESYAKEQAKSLFPGLTAAIDSGMTVDQYVNPYREVAAELLEIPPGQVNFMDSKWRKAVDKIDPKTGVRTAMSLTDWETELRTNKTYGYDTTSQARGQAADLTRQLTEMFGA